jgi:hypothetical protein
MAIYCFLKKALIQSDGSSNEAEAAEEDQFVQKERAKKKRKLTRELREFTRGAITEGERRHKG